MQRMKGMHGVCLRPGEAVLELKVRLYNRTPFTQTFLWWANAATRVHEKYQSFFPPDVRFVADHAKRAITSFPLIQGLYYGVDYGDRARNGVLQMKCRASLCPTAAIRLTTSAGTRTFPSRPATWSLAQSRISSADTTTKPTPVWFTSQIITSRRARSSGRGAIMSSVMHGTAI